jgi:hypothetical protein
MTELLEFANNYFAIHLDGAYWTSQDEATREAALEMARNDLILNNAEESDTLKKAYCEQAVFLIRNYNKQTEGKVVTGQSLPGGLSQSFTLINGDNPGIAPRAARLLKQAKSELPRTIRLARG